MVDNSFSKASSTLSLCFDVFLSHNSSDKPVVEKIAVRLKQCGLEPWLDKWNLTPGGDWQDELAAGIHAASACAVFIGPHGIGNWEELEYRLATDRLAKDRTFRAFIVLLPGLPDPFDFSSLPPFLTTRTWVDLRKGIEGSRALQVLINAIKGVPIGPDQVIAPIDNTCPYRGLEVFDEAHAEYFFGRDADVQRLVERLKTARFLAVVGPSGSGKSSLVRAGLIPAIRRGELLTSIRWPIHLFTPGAAPLAALAAQVVALRPDIAMQKTVDVLDTDQRTLNLAASLAMAQRPAAERIVWVIDQFEELFTLCDNENDRRQFVANLVYAAMVPGGRSVVVLTLRADFYQKCASYPELAAAMAARQALIGPMGADGLRQAIEQPAHRVGLEFEPGLVETILDDVVDRPGRLPLLEHALLELWQRRRGTMLTLEAYRETGGVEGAIAKRADNVFDNLPRGQQSVALRGLTRLVRVAAVDEDGNDTRQRVRLSELSEPARDAAVALTQARLLVMGHDCNFQPVTEGQADQVVGDGVQCGGDPVDAIHPTSQFRPAAGPQNSDGDLITVEVAHEALIRTWPRFRNCLNEDRTFLLWRQRLRHRIDDWRRLNRSPDILLSGELLVEAKRWMSARREDLNKEEELFLRTSERRVARSKNLIIAALSMALLAVLAVATWVYWQRTDTYQVRRIISEVSGDPMLLAASTSESIGTWAAALALYGMPEDATAITSNVKDRSNQNNVYQFAALVLRDEKAYGQSLAMAAKVPNMHSKSDEITSTVKAAISAGKIEDIEGAARNIDNALQQSIACAVIANVLFNAGHIREAKAFAMRGAGAAASVDAEAAYGRAWALSEAAEVLAGVGMSLEAKNAAIEAKLAAGQLVARNPRAGISALSKAAAALAKVGEVQQAMNVVAELPQIDRADAESQVYSAAAMYFMKENLLRQALEAASKMSDILGTGKPSQITIEIAQKLVQTGRFREAEDAAAKFGKSDDARSKAYTAIAQALLKNNRPKEALALAEMIEIPYLRIEVLVEIARELDKARDAEEVKRTVRMLRSTAYEHKPDNRAAALLQVADVLIEIGRLQDARAAVEKAKGEVDQKTLGRRRHENIANIALLDFALAAEEWKQRGTPYNAIDAVVLAVSAAPDRDFARERSPYFDRLAGIIIGISDTPTRMLAEVVQRANTDRSSAAFASLAHALKSAGRLPEAIDAATAARTSISKVEQTNEYRHADDARQAAAALIEVDRPEQALTVAAELKDPRDALMVATKAVVAMLGKLTSKEVLAATSQLPNASIRTHVCRVIAMCLVDAGKRQEAEAAMASAFEAALLVGSEERSRAFNLVATGWARLGRLRLAREAAENCTTPGDKVGAYAAIVIRYRRDLGSKSPILTHSQLTR
jgi:tetratricopeptide (TPR) repeat protein